MRQSLKLFALLFLLQCFKVSAQIPLSGDVATNTSTGTSIVARDVAASEDGRYVFSYSLASAPSWKAYPYKRDYDSNGNPLFTADQQVNNNPGNHSGDREIYVSMNNDGSYVVVYMEEHNTFANTIDHHKIYFRRYNSNGTPAGTRVFVDNGIFPDVDVAPDGSFNISYTNTVEDKVYVKRYTPTGTAFGSRITVASGSVNGFYNTVIKSQNGFVFYVGYQDYNFGGHSIKKFNNSSQQGATMSVPGYINSHQLFSVKPNGDVVAVYTEKNGTYTPTPTYTHKAIRFTASSNFNSYTFETLTPSYTAGFEVQRAPVIGMNDGGEYVIMYAKFINNTYQGLYAQQYCPNDQKVGAEYLVSTSTLNAAVSTSMVDVSACSFVTGWRDVTNNTLFHKRFKLQSPYTAGNDVSIVCGSSTQLGSTITSCTGLPNATFSWSPATGLSSTNTLNPTASPTSTTTYVLTITSGNCQWQEDVKVTVTPGGAPVPSFTVATPICEGANVIVNGSPSTGETAYLWTICQSNAAGSVCTNEWIQPWQSGTAGTINLAPFYNFQGGQYYRIKLAVGNACDPWKELVQVIYINPRPQVSISPQGPLLGCGSIPLTGVTNAAAPYSSTWFYSAFSQDRPTLVGNNTTYSATQTGTYYYSVTDQYGCSNYASVNVAIDQPVSPSFTATTASCATQQVCFNNTTPTSISTTYSWSFPGGTPSSASTEDACVTYPSAGTYDVTLTATNLCGTFQTSQKVDIHPQPYVSITQLGQTTVCGPYTLVAGASGGLAPYTYSWSNPAGATGTTVQVAPMVNNTIYSVTATDAYGCSKTGTITVPNKLPLYGPITHDPIPNVFTPNGDGINDVWKVTDGGKTTLAYNATSFVLKIFNRWGVLLQSATGSASITGFSDNAISWAGGNFNSGTYYYVLSISNCNTTVHRRGKITLLRGSGNRVCQPSTGGGEIKDRIISGRERWSSADNLVTGDITITRNASLVIEQSTLRMSEGSKINVMPGGRLEIIDSEVSACGEKMRWQGIIVRGDRNTRESVKIQGSTIADAIVALRVENANGIQVTDNIITEGVTGIELVRSSDFRIENNKFFDIENGIKTSFSEKGDLSAISSNMFTTQRTAIAFADDDHSNLSIRCNEFFGYTEFAISSMNTTLSDQGSVDEGAGNLFVSGSTQPNHKLNHNGNIIRYYYDPSDPIATNEMTAVAAPSLNDAGCKIQAASSARLTAGDENTEAEGEKMFSLYPNPSNGNMMLTYEIDSNEKGSMIITDMTGKKVAEYSLDNNSSSLSITGLDLPNGVYLYHVSVDSKVVKAAKLVIIK